MAADFVKMDGAKVKTVNGAELTIRVSGSDVMLMDATGASVKVVKTDVTASNGVIHVIDGCCSPRSDPRPAPAGHDPPCGIPRSHLRYAAQPRLRPGTPWTRRERPPRGHSNQRRRLGQKGQVGHRRWLTARGAGQHRGVNIDPGPPCRPGLTILTVVVPTPRVRCQTMARCTAGDAWSPRFGTSRR